MSTAYGDPVQIVRKRRNDEPIPDYSTAALLYGCTWPVRIEKRAKGFGPELLTMEPSNGAEIMKERRDAKFAPHRETIIDLLQKKIPMTVIARVIGMQECSTALYIKVHELKKVANA